MTESEWIDQATRDLPKLKQIVAAFHPANQTPMQQFDQRVNHGLRITAPSAEAACQAIRNDVQKTFDGDPVAQLEEAVTRRDVSKVMTLLNQAWFGVPESSGCYGITGFRQAVALLEDPPEDP